MGRDPPLINMRPWSPGQMDAAETFGEVDVSVSADNGLVYGGDPGAVRFAPEGGYLSGANASNTTEARGIAFVPNQTCKGLTARVALNILDDDNGTLVLSEYGGAELASSNAGSGTEVDFDVTIEAGTKYVLTWDDGGDSYQSAEITESLPYSEGGFTITDGVTGAANLGNTPYNIDYIAPRYPGETSASATITWPEPADLAGWDIIPFEATEDGATVEVYAIDEDTGDTLAGPLDDPGDISTLARSKNVGVGVELTRSDTSQNPRLEAVYRRYKV